MFLDTPSDIATLKVDLFPRGLLPAAGTLTGDELLAILQNGVNTWTTIDLLAAIISASSSLVANVTIEKNDALIGTRSKLNLIEGANVTLTVADDAGGGEVDITIAATGGGGGAPVSASYVVIALDGTLTGERRLQVGAPLTLVDGGANGDVTLDFDEAASLGNNARTAVSKNSGATIGTRRRLNLIEGTNITLTVVDDVGNEEVDVTIDSAGGSGLTHPQVMSRVSMGA